MLLLQEAIFPYFQLNQLYESEIRLKQEQAALLYKFLNPYDENIMTVLREV